MIGDSDIKDTTGTPVLCAVAGPAATYSLMGKIWEQNLHFSESEF